jgi:flagellar biosynthesis/type III secretory pathway M-ring protein FliF/YscJ
MPFAQEDTDMTALAKEKRMDLIMSALKIVGFLAIMALVLLFVLKPMTKWVTKSVRVVERTRSLEGGDTEELEQLEGGEGVPQLEVGAKSEEMKRAVQGKRKAIEHSAKGDMNTATAVVKSWLQENV